MSPRHDLRGSMALALLLTLSLAAADDSAAGRRALAQEIRERIHAIESARAEHLARRAAVREERHRVESVIAGLAARRERAQEAIEERSQWLERAQADLDRLRGESERAEAKFDAWGRAAAPVAARLAELVRAGIPYRREQRGAAFEESARLLAAAGQRAEGLRRLLSEAAAELQLAVTREVRPGEIAVANGIEKHAFIARFGLVNEIFVSEDGTCAGRASREKGPPWIVFHDRPTVDALSRVLDCARRKRAPALLAIPFAVERKR